jgi:hypothetical protein
MYVNFMVPLKKFIPSLLLSLLALISLTGCPTSGGKTIVREIGERAIGEGVERAGSSASKSSGERVARQRPDVPAADSPRLQANAAVSNAEIGILGKPTWERVGTTDIRVFMKIYKRQSDRRKVYNIVSSCKSGFESPPMSELSSDQLVKIQEHIKYLCNQISQQSDAN